MPVHAERFVTIGAAVLFTVVAGANVVIQGAAALAADAGPGSLSGTLWVDLQNDFQPSSDTATEELNNTLLSVETQAVLTLTDALRLNGGLVYEQVQLPAVAGDDRLIDDHGLYVKSLNLEYGRDKWSVAAGKMHVNFARAWEMAPGIYGADLAYDYEMAGTIALKGSYRVELGAGGKHRMTAQSFFTDTSGLAESAFTRRGKTRQGTGGPGNTGGFNSFAVSLDGGDVAALPGFTYHAAYVHLANDSLDAKSEKRWAVTAMLDHDLGGGYRLQPLIEYVLFRDADGTAGQDRDYLSTGMALYKGPWNLSFSATFKETRRPGAADAREEFMQLTGGHEFANGFSFNMGYKRKRNAGADTDIIGALLSYALSY